MAEQSSNKRTPTSLKMTHLTEDTFTQLLTQLNYPKPFTHLIPTIFDPETDKEMSVDGNIEQSGNNYYQKGFTTELYNSLPLEQKNKINAYFKLEDGKPVVTQYSINDKYHEELTYTIHWLYEALAHVKLYLESFDIHIVNSLDLLTQYFTTGDENLFKAHSIEWLKTNSRLDYTMGFIETYHDPMKIRGHASGEVTIKLANMEKMNKVLSEIEQRVPIPVEYKKDKDSGVVMNVSPNKALFAAGDYGPTVIIAAYCLPNYDDIRSKVGSKQILYKLPKSLTQTLNPDLAKSFRTKSRSTFIELYDKDNEIMEDLWDVQVLLHEISHGSGKLHAHTFKEGENLIINNITYQIGDTIPLTDENYAEFIKEDSDSLEELRAEINALYMSINEMDTLNEEGQFKNWLNILGKEELQKQCIIEMCSHVFGGLLSQGENMTNIKGAHARANFVITNYLLAHGGIAINKETKNVDGHDYTLLEIVVTDLHQANKNIVKLLQRVQKIKSTGDTLDCKELFGTYTTYPITIEESRTYRKYMLDIRKKLMGDIKETVKIFPQFIPVFNNENKIIDVEYKPSNDIFQQNLYQESLTLTIDN
jgi:hypothetical protein